MTDVCDAVKGAFDKIIRCKVSSWMTLAGATEDAEEEEVTVCSSDSLLHHLNNANEMRRRPGRVLPKNTPREED